MGDSPCANHIVRKQVSDKPRLVGGERKSNPRRRRTPQWRRAIFQEMILPAKAKARSISQKPSKDLHCPGRFAAVASQLQKAKDRTFVHVHSDDAAITKKRSIAFGNLRYDPS